MKARAVEQFFDKALLGDRLRSALAWEERHPDGKQNPYVTDVGQCPRKVFKSLRNDPETNPPDATSLLNFALGRSVEDVFCGIMASEGAIVHREVPVEIEVADPVLTKVSGRADVLLEIPGVRGPVELKSTSSKNMRWMIRQKQWGQKNHRDQLLLYLHSGQLGGLQTVGFAPGDCDSGVLGYLVKDATKGQRNTYFFEVAYDPYRAGELLWGLATMNAYFKEGLPEPPIPDGYKPNKFPCGYCVFLDACWGAYGD